MLFVCAIVLVAQFGAIAKTLCASICFASAFFVRSHYDHTGGNLDLKTDGVTSKLNNNTKFCITVFVCKMILHGPNLQSWSNLCFHLNKPPRVVVGPTKEKNKVPGIDVTVGEGDKVKFGTTEAIVMDVGGHTNGHIAYYFPEAQKVFCGDALFALGCGRMFEGTPTQFWKSLRSLRELPDETTVYW